MKSTGAAAWDRGGHFLVPGLSENLGTGCHGPDSRHAQAGRHVKENGEYDAAGEDDNDQNEGTDAGEDRE